MKFSNVLIINIYNLFFKHRRINDLLPLTSSWLLSFIGYQVLWKGLFIRIDHEDIRSTCVPLYTVIPFILWPWKQRWDYKCVVWRKCGGLSDDDFRLEHLSFSGWQSVCIHGTVRTFLCKINCFAPHSTRAESHIKPLLTSKD